MVRAPMALFALMTLACSSSAPPAEAPAHAEAPSVSAAPADAGQDRIDAAATSSAGSPADARDAALQVTNDGVGPLRTGMEASEESLAILFPQCEASWQRHKGRRTPHVQITCAGAHVMDVVLVAQGQSGAVDYVQVYQEGVRTPSGLGVGSSYRALAELTDNLVCRGIRADSGGPSVIVRDHTLCMSPLFPRVAYVLPGVVFKTGETPAGADELRISEIRWSP